MNLNKTCLSISQVDIQRIVGVCLVNPVISARSVQ